VGVGKCANGVSELSVRERQSERVCASACVCVCARA